MDRRDRGVPGLRGGRGSLVVTIQVETPTKLDAAQEELLRQLAAACLNSFGTADPAELRAIAPKDAKTGAEASKAAVGVLFQQLENRNRRPAAGK